LCRHVGHVLFTLSHRDKLDALNICPQCRIRETRCSGSNTSCVIEHMVLIGLAMFLNTTRSTRSFNWV
jgi:hypothetical protein